jgi:hypothetical protein
VRKVRGGEGRGGRDTIYIYDITGSGPKGPVRVSWRAGGAPSAARPLPQQDRLATSPP